MQKTALITGASKGIGLALTKQLLEDNYTVIGTSRNGIISGIQHKNFQSIALDLSNTDKINEASRIINLRFSRIDLLINNAGVGFDLYTEKPELNSFQKTFNINVTGTVFFTENILNLISNEGIIINMSSKMGAITVCNLYDSVAYRMSKSALNMYTKILSNRLKGKAKVVSMHPGWVKTNIADGNFENARLTAQEAAKNMIRFINSDMKTILFWDSETDKELFW